MPLERLPAPTDGINATDAPEYIKTTECQDITNWLTGYKGKLITRGPIRSVITGMSTTSTGPEAFWSFDDKALIRTQNTGTKYYLADVAAGTKTDVTASLTKTPTSDVHERFGDFVFGAIDDANAPALGRWDGNTTVVLQTNAPFKFTDLKAHVRRLFVLGGTVPGAGGATAVKPRTLYWCDVDAADLSVLTAWQDDVSGLTNQLNFNSDDTPVGLATCGRWLAILGSRSINLLTGVGTSDFAVRNVTKEYGCLDKNSIVETTSGFYFMSDRGYAFCDGASVQIVGNNVRTSFLQGGVFVPSTSFRAVNHGHGYIGVWGNTAGAYLLHIDSGAWTKVLPARVGAVVRGIWNTASYPVWWDNGSLLRADLVTSPLVSNAVEGMDNDGAANRVIPTTLTYRVPKLAGASNMCRLTRLLIDYQISVDAGTMSLPVFIFDWRGATIASLTIPVDAVTFGRRRAAIDVNVEADTLTVQIGSPVGVTGVSFVPRYELLDVHLEFEPARPRPTI